MSSLSAMAIALSQLNAIPQPGKVTYKSLGLPDPSQPLSALKTEQPPLVPNEQNASMPEDVSNASMPPDQSAQVSSQPAAPVPAQSVPADVPPGPPVAPPGTPNVPQVVQPAIPGQYLRNVSAEEIDQARQKRDAALAYGRLNVERGPVEAGKEIRKQEKITQGFKDRTAARDAEADAISARETALEPEMSETRKTYQLAIEKHGERALKAQTDLQTMNDLSQKIASETPRDMFAEASTPLKIATILATGFGAGVQALYGDKTNTVLEQVDAYAKRDLMFQKMRLENDQNSYANKNLLLNQYMKTSDNIQEASTKAYVTMMEGFKARLEFLKGQTGDIQRKQQYDQAITGLDMQASGKRMEMIQTMVGDVAKHAQVEAHTHQQDISSSQAASKVSAGAGREARIAQEKEVVDYKGVFTGQAGAAEKFRAADTASRQVTNRLLTLKNDLSKGTVKNLTSWGNYQALMQDIASVIEKAKGSGLMNTGANFTPFEGDLIAAGYMTKKGEILYPKEAAALIDRKIAQLWDDMAIDAHIHGLDMDETHRYAHFRTQTKAAE